MFRLTIRTSGVAFQDDAEGSAGWEYEVARILRDTANAVEHEGMKRGSLRDSNGKVVGEFSYKP